MKQSVRLCKSVCVSLKLNGFIVCTFVLCTARHPQMNLSTNYNLCSIIHTETIMATSSSASMGSTNNASTPLSTKSGDSPQKVMPPTNTTTSPPRTVIPTQPKVMSPTKAMSPPRTAVTILKEYCEKERLPEPLYSEIPQDVEQHFQYKVVITVTSVRTTAIGNVCGSKQQAKQSAAQSALQKLRIL